MKRTSLFTLVGIVALSAAASFAASDAKHPKQLHWPFDGYFGAVDKQAAQRGFQVYKEVCASCHSLKRVAIRQLTDLGFSEAETKALAASYSVQDGPDEAGDMFERPGKPSDKFPGPFANDNAARAANGGALPPDLSLIIKARHDGANYVHSLLTGYQEAPEDVAMNAGMNYNPYFPGGQIAMAAPLIEGLVSYEDGTEATIDQMARDVVIFLQWAAEPEMERRKAMGLKVLVFLLIMTGFLYAAKQRIWRNIEH